MNNRFEGHTFHIPVMGIGFTIDTPVKVAQYGISSVISLVDDILMEKMRAFYCLKFHLPFDAIAETISDFRAKRITAYLNMIQQVVRIKVEELKKSIDTEGAEYEAYVAYLPDTSVVKQTFKR